MGGASKSEEVIQKIIQIKDKCICVRGNRENYIIEGMPLVIHDEKRKTSQEQMDRNEWIKSHLSEVSKQYIHKLPKELFYKIDGKSIYIVHYPMNANEKFRKHIKLADIKENEEMFSEIDADIYLYGHTHASVYNKNHNKIYINPGALGCLGKTNKAPYGILNICNNKIEYEQLAVEYNVQKVIEDINKIKFPGYEGVLKTFYGIDNKEMLDNKK